MADVLVPTTPLSLNDAVADPAGTLVTSADTGYITKSASLVDSITNPVARGQVELSEVVLRFDPATSATVTILAGENPPSNRSSATGDLVLALGSDTSWVTLEAANYTWNDGTVRFTTSANVTVSVLETPKSL